MASMANLKPEQDSTTQLGTDSIWRLLMRFSLPSIVSMTVSAVYNIADRVFIGVFVGELALGGLTASFPLIMIIMSFGSLFAAGGTSLISIEFGRQNKEKASRLYGSMMLMVFLFMLTAIVAASVFLSPLLQLIGATPGNLRHAMDYTQIILFGMLFQFPSMVLAALIRVEGRPRLSMASQLIAGTTNVILNYVFIGVFGWGVPGAAWATIIGQFVGFCIMIWYFFFSGQSQLRLSLSSLRPRWRLIRQICAVGSSSFFGQITNSISGAVLIMAISSYGGDAAMAAVGAMSSLATLAIMPIFGLQQGLAPIVGYNFGMNRGDRVKSALIRGIGIAVGIASLIFALLQLFPATFAAMFIDPASPTMAICVRAMRLNMLMMPLIPMGIVGSAYFQSTAQAGKALFLGVSRAFVFLLPFVLILPPILGLDGVWLAQPAADLCSISITLVLLVHAMKKYRTNK